jgi:hypothetical protein
MDRKECRELDSLEGVEMKRLTLIVILTLISISLTVSSAIAATDSPAAKGHERKRFRAGLQTTTRLVEPPPGRCSDRPGLSPVVGLLEVIGSGDATFLGPVVDEQSHCVRADGSFFGGVFKLTNADGDTIRGLYFGQLEPTFNSTFPPPAPGGPWLIIGNACISGGSAGDIDNDCSANRYEPARGITNLSTGDATIFLDQTIDID